MEVNNAKFDENADESPADAQKSDDHKKLLEYGIHESVADRLDEIYKSGKIVKIKFWISAVILYVNFSKKKMQYILIQSN